MASIIKREGKKGVSYLIQVKVTLEATGEKTVKSTTWKPLPGMTQKQIEKELLLASIKFEEDMKLEATRTCEPEITADWTFKEYSDKWLERVEKEFSLSYFSNSRSILEIICGFIGNYKLRRLTPSIIQGLYDKLDKLEKEIVSVKAKSCIKEVMAQKGVRYTELRYKYGINSSSLSIALRGNPVSEQIAQKMADAIGVPLDSVFDVTKRKEPYAYETMHKIKRTVRAVLSCAKRQRLITENYAKSDYITVPKRPPKEIKCMDDQAAKKFYKVLNQTEDSKAKTAMLIALLCGLRRGEICGLEWDDINFEKNTIKIQRSVTTVRGFGVIEKDPKTETSKRTISVPPSLIAQLKEHKTWQDGYKESLGDRWEETNRLFTGQFGGTMHPHNLSVWLGKILKAAGIPHVTLHSIRHTNITMQIMNGVPLVIVAGRAGHARTSTTTDIYAHFLRSADETAATVIESMFSE